jgi:hypothetical protein
MRTGGLIVLALALQATPALSQVTADDIARSLHLREKLMYLTRDVADPAAWSGDDKLFYRKTVEGGFAFVTYDVKTGAKTASFDQARIATGLGKATNTAYDPLRLPFESFTFADNGAAIRFSFNEAGWRCTLTDYVCAEAPRPGRPSGFGVVRDLAVPAANPPRRSPDGKWEAHVENFNIAVRPVGGAWKRISADGSDANFYDPESIVWSPDSAKLAAYRVRPGFRRIVTRVESSPADQVQPKLQTQLYPKPGDAVDIEQPVVFLAAEGKQLATPDALFSNPYDLSKLEWRKDSATVSFIYEQRGHQLARVVEIDAKTGAPRAVVTEAVKTFINEGRRFHQDIDNGREVIWMSERDGWNHLYLFDGKTGAVKTQITKGPWVVRQVLKVDEAKRQIYFAAGGMVAGQDPYFQQVYRIGFDGKGLTSLTTADAYHDVALSPDASLYVDTYSRVDLPPVSELRRTSDQSLVATLEKPDISQLVAAGSSRPSRSSPRAATARPTSTA